MLDTGNIKAVYHSVCDYEDSLNLNLFKNHFSYITKLEHYLKRFQCAKCFRFFPKLDPCKRHQKVCSLVNKTKLNCGFYALPSTIFQELENFGIGIPDCEKIYPFFIVYDFEAILEATQQKVSKNLIWTHKHKPISVSLCSNDSLYGANSREST